MLTFFFREKRCTHYDNFMMFENLTLTPFCLEKTSLRIMVFQWALGWDQVNYARVMITYVCYYSCINICCVTRKLFGENQFKNNGVSVGLRLGSGKICKSNDHICLFHRINTCRVPREMVEHPPISLLFKQLPRNTAKVNA